MKRILISAIFLGHAGATLLMLILPWTLMVHAETPGGRWVGVAFVLFLFSPLSLWLIAVKNARLIALFLAPLLFVGGMLFYSCAVAEAPQGKIPGAALSQSFSGNCQFNKRGISNVVPEIDQLMLGTYVFPLLDPFIDGAQGKRIRKAFLGVYRDMRQDDAFVEAGSVLGMCYENILSGQTRELHYYQYIPEKKKEGPYPVIVFMHGSLGNFKGYTWVLKDLADREGYVIIAPTFGAGNWWLDADGSVLTGVYTHITENPELDESRIILAGLSNGGTGVSREIKRAGNRYTGFIYFSPSIESSIVSQANFTRQVADKPVLIIHGNKDRRIPYTYVKKCDDIMRANQLEVTSRYYPEEDHFLFFSRRDDVMQDVINWLDADS